MVQINLFPSRNRDGDPENGYVCGHREGGWKGGAE